MSETCITTAYYYHHNNVIDIFCGYPLWDDNPNMWMQRLELSLEVLVKMFMFDSFQNGSIKLINMSWAY